VQSGCLWLSVVGWVPRCSLWPRWRHCKCWILLGQIDWVLIPPSEPTAGGQYHWVGAFAPPSLQKPASYIVGKVVTPSLSCWTETDSSPQPGWLCALGWQSAVAGPANVGASIAVGFAVVANSSYVPQNWHIVALTILIISWATIFNVFFARKLPAIEAAAFTLYVLVFFAFVIVMFAVGPRSGAKEMFTDFQDNAGWGSIGAACFVGVSGPVIVIIGSDSSVHLAEELKDAARQLPKAMLASAGINYVLGFVTLVAFVAVVGNVEDVLASPTGQPFIQVLLNITQSSKATMAMTFFVVFIFAVGVVNANTTSSRQLYAFSRDGGLPFSRWISYVSLSIDVPRGGILLTVG
jgi:choline transport protein